MDLPITPFDPDEKVEFQNPPKAFFEAIGGEEGMRRLMYRFYDKIYESDIAHFFPQDEEEFAKVKEKNTAFFIQICGGPKVYDESQGDLNDYMIRFHDDFSIDEKARTEWLATMRETLEELEGVDEEAIRGFWDYVEAFSKLTVNRYAKKRRDF